MNRLSDAGSIPARSIKNIHRVIPCGCFLFTKLLCTFFQHFADWQMVRTSGFTFAAFYTGGSLHRKRTVTVSCPVSQPVTVKIACEQEHTRNIDSHTAWSTVITSAAEICAKLIPYCPELPPVLSRLTGNHQDRPLYSPRFPSLPPFPGSQ